VRSWRVATLLWLWIPLQRWTPSNSNYSFLEPDPAKTSINILPLLPHYRPLPPHHYGQESAPDTADRADHPVASTEDLEIQQIRPRDQLPQGHRLFTRLLPRLRLLCDRQWGGWLSSVSETPEYTGEKATFPADVGIYEFGEAVFGGRGFGGRGVEGRFAGEEDLGLGTVDDGWGKISGFVDVGVVGGEEDSGG